MDLTLTIEHQSTLLRIAREAIAVELRGDRLSIDVAGYDETLTRPAGAFVTLRTVDRGLRGCIGSVFPSAPLARAVALSASNAAFRDPRFPPVSDEELHHLRLEVSVMGPIVPVTTTDEIVPGRDGLIVSAGRNAGLLLPQVATEQGWDRLTFLSHTCLKAGLPPDAWRSPNVRIDRFQAHVFGE